MDGSDAPKSQKDTSGHAHGPHNAGTLGNGPPGIGSNPPPPGERNHSNRNPNMPPWWEILKFIAEIALVGITLKIACIYSGQLEEMRKATVASVKSAQAAKDAVELQQRLAINQYGAHMDAFGKMVDYSLGTHQIIGGVAIRNTARAPVQEISVAVGGE